MAQAYAQALQTIIGEFRNVSPEIVSSFIFLMDGQVIARDGDITPEIERKVISAVEGIREQGKRLGGLETFTIQGSEGQLNLTSIGNLCLVTVSSRAADQKVIKTLTQVIIPTVVKLAEQLAPELAKTEISGGVEPEHFPSSKPTVLPKIEIDTPEASTVEEPTDETPSVLSSDALVYEAPVSQFMVEKIGGFMVANDTVRFQNEIASKWSDLNGGRQIKTVEIQTLEGKLVTCKFKASKEVKSGVIQIPEKLLQTLQTSKGTLVMVKPVVEVSK